MSKTLESFSLEACADSFMHSLPHTKAFAPFKAIGIIGHLIFLFEVL